MSYRAASAILILALATTAAGPISAPELYELSGVKRVDQDLYRSSEGIYIETQYCYHYTYGEDVVLRWEGKYAVNNKIYWENDSTCAVKSVWKK